MSKQHQVSKNQREFQGASNEKARSLLQERAQAAYTQRSRSTERRTTGDTPSQKFLSGFRVVRNRMV